MPLIFTIKAGKPETDDGNYYENIKFCYDAMTLEDAQRIIQEKKLYTYPICRVVVSGFEVA